MQTSPQLAIRILPANPNHHLWNNHGSWWCHYTVHLPDFTKRRVRRSLATRSVQEAREIRDFLLATAGPGGVPADVHPLPVNCNSN